MVIKRRFETGRISIVRGSRGVLVKAVVFHLRGCGHPQDHAILNFIKFFNSHYSDLSIEVYKVSIPQGGQKIPADKARRI